MSTATEREATALDQAVRQIMEQHHVPGVGLGIIHGDEETLAGYGSTSVENPLPVDGNTLFQIGSITKTVTGTALMRLVEAGKLDLDAPLRAYLPKLQLPTDEMTANATSRHLLTHTGGWLGDYFTDQGRGEDALALTVASMQDIPILSRLGELWSYSNSSFYLAGRLIEALTGQTYEDAARELVLDPLGMDNSFFFPEEVMTHRFAVGHTMVPQEGSDGASPQPQVARSWALPRSAHPAGGLACSAHDLLKYARFHLGDGPAPDGTRLLSADALRLMQTPLRPASGDEWVGLTWFIREVDGLHTVRHGGGTNGQISSFVMVPEHRFALAVLTNLTGMHATGEITNWILEHELGIKQAVPEAIESEPEQLAEFAGRYLGATYDLVISLDEQGLSGQLITTMRGGSLAPEMRPPSPPPAGLALSNRGGLIFTGGDFKGTPVEVIRNTAGAITHLRLGGRLYPREL